jgi:hypothetical protein
LARKIAFSDEMVNIEGYRIVGKKKVTGIVTLVTAPKVHTAIVTTTPNMWMVDRQAFLYHG